MKSIKLTIVFLLLCTAGVGNAMADHGHYGHHAHFGVVIGPYWGSWYYPPPPYYYPPYYSSGIVERAPPTVYIEQQTTPPESAQAPQTNYWYYCGTPKGYYPYIKECPSGWQKVLPQPPDQP